MPNLIFLRLYGHRGNGFPARAGAPMLPMARHLNSVSQPLGPVEGFKPDPIVAKQLPIESPDEIGNKPSACSYDRNRRIDRTIA
jgi:hypothetical protein